MASSHTKLSDFFYGVGLSNVPDPTFYWKCVEASGNLIDQQGNLDITEVGTVPSSGVGRGIFTGSNYFRVATVADPLPWNWSSDSPVICSLKFNSTNTNDIILEKQAGIKISTITKLINTVYYTTVQFEVGGVTLYGKSNIQDGVDHWIQLASIGNKIRLYIDRVREFTVDNTISNTGIGALAVGIGQAGSGNEYNGTVGKIFIKKSHEIIDWNTMESVLIYLTSI